MPNFPEKVRAKSISGELRLVSVGRIMHGKGYIYALQGFYQFLLSGGKGTYTIIGEGPEEMTLKKFVTEHGLQQNVVFKGFINNDEVKIILDQSHVLLHPSFREGGSWSIMEAMAFGLPVICLDASGPRDMVTQDCGFLIELSDPEGVVRQISTSLSKLTEDKELYLAFSENARNRIKSEYNWEKRGAQIRKVYESVLGDL